MGCAATLRGCRSAGAWTPLRRWLGCFEVLGCGLGSRARIGHTFRNGTEFASARPENTLTITYYAGIG